MTSSLSLRILADIDRKIVANFRQSRTKSLLETLLMFCENSFDASKFKKILGPLSKVYPETLWRPIDKVNARVNLAFLLNPFILFPFAYVGFVGISTYRPSLLATISIVAGLLSFMVGVRVVRKLKFREIFLEEYTRSFSIVLLIIGSAALLLDINRAGAMPLFEPFAKKGLSVTYTMLATLIVPGGILAISAVGARFKDGRIKKQEARVYAIGILIATTFLVSPLGYRTQIIVSLLGCSLAMFFSGIIGWAEIVGAFLAAFTSISAVGYIRALGEGTSIGILEVIGRRIGLTLSIYDTLVNLYWPFGVNRGSVALATFSSYFSFIPGPSLGPRTIVARMFGVYDISMTSTLFGTVMLDFGIIGIMVSALVLGAIIGSAYRAVQQTQSPMAVSILSLLLAYLLVGIETGLVDFNVFMFFLAGAIILVKSVK
jgi:oligosaccharide repeat unit polymerase